jgi:hypothetical protein
LVQDNWFVFTPAKLEEVKTAEVDLQETNAAIGRRPGNPDLLA